MKISEFWNEIYFPHVQKNCKPSTIAGYTKLWECYLAEEFAGKTLSEYRTVDATQFLTRLAEQGLGTRTVAHARSLASGIFRHAVRLGLLSVNPWHDAGSLVKPIKPVPTTAYSLQEIQAIISALSEDKLAQIAVALAAYAGLRPSEIAGLRWEDVQENALVLRRSVWNGIMSDSLKTEGSAAKVPLLSVLKGMLDSLPDKEGWVLGGSLSPVQSMDEFARHRISEPLRKRGIRFAGVYAFRRSCSTIVTELTGSPFAAQAILRHSNVSTTLAFYFRPERERLAAQGIAALESALQDQKALSAGIGAD